MDGASVTTGHPVLEGAYNMICGIQFITLYIYTSLLLLGYQENVWKLLYCGLHHYLEDRHRLM